MKDSSVRHEMSNVEVAVKAAKEAEALLAMLAGVSKGKGPAGGREGGTPLGPVGRSAPLTVLQPRGAARTAARISLS
jgi:hypothetical protein